MPSPLQAITTVSRGLLVGGGGDFVLLSPLAFTDIYCSLLCDWTVPCSTPVTAELRKGDGEAASLQWVTFEEDQRSRFTNGARGVPGPEIQIID